MSDVQRFKAWADDRVSGGSSMRCVKESDYDACVQKLSAKCAELDSYRAECDAIGNWRRERDALRAEVERLRGALRGAIESADNAAWSMGLPSAQPLHSWYEAARAALAQPAEGK